MILSLLLKKALPFALTFVVGTALGGLTWLFGGPEKKGETVVVTRTYEFGSRCRMRHKLVAETKPLNILDTPSAFWSAGHDAWPPTPVRMLVTFGSDGTVQGVEQLDHFQLPKAITEEAKLAAWRIKFEPEKVNSLPVTVKREVEINFWVE